MKKSPWSLLILLSLAAVIWWFGRPAPQTPAESPKPTPQATSAPKKADETPTPLTNPVQVQAVMEAPPPPKAPVRIEAPPPKPVQPPPDYFESIQNSPQRQEAEEIALQFRNYGQRFGGNPTGTNAEIVQALRGANQARANYLPQNARLSEKGELIDTWGTPYFFHSNSALETEIRSAGPDKKLHTPDDIVTK
jgi:hypothetical protein